MPSDGYGVRRLLCRCPSTRKNETQAHERGRAKNGLRTHSFIPNAVDPTRAPSGTNHGRPFRVCSTIDSSPPLRRRTGINRWSPKSQRRLSHMDLDQSADCCVCSDLSLVRWSASPEMNLACNFGPINTAKSASVYECFPFIWPYNALFVNVADDSRKSRAGNRVRPTGTSRRQTRTPVSTSLNTAREGAQKCSPNAFGSAHAPRGSKRTRLATAEAPNIRTGASISQLEKRVVVVGLGVLRAQARRSSQRWLANRDCVADSGCSVLRFELHAGDTSRMSVVVSGC
jgi:hypothetical protein